MILYIPYKNLKRCAKVLSDDLLKSQIGVTQEILTILKNKQNKLYSDPGILMWANYKNFVRNYRNILIRELYDRKVINRYVIVEVTKKIRVPDFIGNKEFHDSHKAALIRLKVTYLEKAIKNKEKNYLDIANNYFKSYQHLHNHCKWKHINPEIPYYWPTKIK